MDRLLREGNPPAGQLASPKPQYKKPGVDEYAPVEGQHGAPFATLKDASGNVVSPATEEKLEQARVLLNTISTKDFATQTTLAAVLAKLEQLETEIQAVKANQVSGDQKVQLSGTDAEPVNVQLSGQLQIMDRISRIEHELGPGETYKTERPLDASKIQSDIATIVVAESSNTKRDIDVYVSMKPQYTHETEKMLVYSSLEDAVPQATHVFNIVLQYPEFYLHVTNRSSYTFRLQNITLVGRGVR